MELKQGAIGSEGSYDLKIENGKVEVSVSYAGDQVGAQLSVNVSVRAFLDKLAAAIPGSIDDSVIKALEAALGL